MYVCTYVCKYVCMYACMYVCIDGCMCMCLSAYIYVYVYLPIYLVAHVYGIQLHVEPLVGYLESLAVRPESREPYECGRNMIPRGIHPPGSKYSHHAYSYCILRAPYFGFTVSVALPKVPGPLRVRQADDLHPSLVLPEKMGTQGRSWFDWLSFLGPSRNEELQHIHIQMM